MANKIFIVHFNKDIFSHILSDCEYLSQSTIQQLNNPCELSEGDMLIIYGNTIRYFQNYHSLLVLIKDVFWDDSPIITYAISPQSDIGYISDDTLEYLKIMEYEHNSGTIFPFSEDEKIVNILFPCFSKSVFTFN